VISKFDDDVVRDAEANVLQWASAAEGVFPNGSPLFRRAYYVCTNGHWSIADSNAKILPCNSCPQIAERDYEIIERRSRASRAEAGEVQPISRSRHRRSTRPSA